MKEEPCMRWSPGGRQSWRRRRDGGSTTPSLAALSSLADNEMAATRVAGTEGQP